MLFLLLHRSIRAAEAAKIALGLEGVGADVAIDADDAVSLVRRRDYDGLVVDCEAAGWGGPGQSENLLIRLGSQHSSPPPALAVVPGDDPARRENVTLRVQALRAGFMDVIDSAWTHKEFVARLRNMALRHAGLVAPAARFGHFEIDFCQRRCFRLRPETPETPRDDIHLPHRAYDLLEYLVLRRNRVGLAHHILDRFDGALEEGEPIDAAGLAIIARQLRAVLAPYGLDQCVAAAVGWGFRFDPAACDLTPRAA